MACPLPLRVTLGRWKNPKIFIHHKLQNGGEILKKIQNLFLSKKNGRGPSPSGWPYATEKISKFLFIISYKIGKGILKKFQNLIFSKKMGVLPPPQGDPRPLKNSQNFYSS